MSAFPQVLLSQFKSTKRVALKTYPEHPAGGQSRVSISPHSQQNRRPGGVQMSRPGPAALRPWRFSETGLLGSSARKRVGSGWGGCGGSDSEPPCPMRGLQGRAQKAGDYCSVTTQGGKLGQGDVKQSLRVRSQRPPLSFLELPMAARSWDPTGALGRRREVS